MAKKEDVCHIIDMHKPKHFKFRIFFKDDDFIEELQKNGYDMDSCDTINDQELTMAAYNCDFTYYERTIIGKANEPYVMEDGVIVAKKMISKVDKRLEKVGVGFFNHDDTSYVTIKFIYDKFDIIEIFIILRPE